jgi:hypothetical protein
MGDLPRSGRSLFEHVRRSRAARRARRPGLGRLRRRGPRATAGALDDLARVRRELGLVIRVHPGLPDEATCRGLGEVGIDGAMVDVIGHPDTARDVYHLDAAPDDYEAALARLERHGVPTVPHIILVRAGFPAPLAATRAGTDPAAPWPAPARVPGWAGRDARGSSGSRPDRRSRRAACAARRRCTPPARRAGTVDSRVTNIAGRAR